MTPFGRARLGYLRIETTRFSDGRRFAADGVGLHVDDLDTDGMGFRLDEQQCRFLLRRGPAEDVTAAGWHVDDEATCDAIVGRVRDSGVPVTIGSAEDAALRGVQRLVRFPGPEGMKHEVSVTPLNTATA